MRKVLLLQDMDSCHLSMQWYRHSMGHPQDIQVKQHPSCLDFQVYLGDRVRQPQGLAWNPQRCQFPLSWPVLRLLQLKALDLHWCQPLQERECQLRW